MKNKDFLKMYRITITYDGKVTQEEIKDIPDLFINETFPTDMLFINAEGDDNDDSIDLIFDWVIEESSLDDFHREVIKSLKYRKQMIYKAIANVKKLKDIKV